MRLSSIIPQKNRKRWRKKTEKDYRDVARSKGARWLGKSLPKDVRTNTLWQCGCGETFERKYCFMKDGTGLCKSCSRKQGDAKRSDALRIDEAGYIKQAKAQGMTYIGPHPPNVNTKTLWLCKCGDEYPATYASVRKGHKCLKCKALDSRSYTEQDFHEAAKERGGKWLGDKVTSAHEKTTWECACGKIIRRKLPDFLSANSCRHCAKVGTGSIGESKIAEALERLGVSFTREKTFKGLRGIKNRLRFDFYLPLFGTIIEFHGRQHYVAEKYFGGRKKLKTTQKNDRKKEQWCRDNNVRLIVIPYWDLGDIDSIIEKEIAYARNT